MRESPWYLVCHFKHDSDFSMKIWGEEHSGQREKGCSKQKYGVKSRKRVIKLLEAVNKYIRKNSIT